MIEPWNVDPSKTPLDEIKYSTVPNLDNGIYIVKMYDPEASHRSVYFWNKEAAIAYANYHGDDEYGFAGWHKVNIYQFDRICEDGKISLRDMYAHDIRLQLISAGIVEKEDPCADFIEPPDLKSIYITEIDPGDEDEYLLLYFSTMEAALTYAARCDNKEDDLYCSSVNFYKFDLLCDNGRISVKEFYDY
ncbi:hypothetical protein [Chroococcidiopsis sp.]|uniref:hypothetical protein n=1 Tax=Chroococcidiopsis sp. TaxID=3088168 RepID=UPI003F326990